MRRVDAEATEARRFLDKRSRIMTDGTERLSGQDMGIQHNVVLERDKFKCTQCGSRKYLEVHHISPRWKGRDDSLRNLKTICLPCHAKLHRVPGARQARERMANQ